MLLLVLFSGSLKNSPTQLLAVIRHDGSRSAMKSSMWWNRRYPVDRSRTGFRDRGRSKDKRRRCVVVSNVMSGRKLVCDECMVDSKDSVVSAKGRIPAG